MKKVVSLLVAVVMVFGLTLYIPEAPVAYAEKFIGSGSPFDLGIANDEKLIQMLKDQGRIPQNASASEAEKALASFLKTKAEKAKKDPGELVRDNSVITNALKNSIKNNGIFNGKGNKLGHTKGNLDGVQAETWNGEVTKDKVLVLLIDFPDYPHNSIRPNETDMYYTDYTKEHYQQMIFGKNGYTGPNGENFISMKQYYEQQSGGSYTVEGAVAGWYTAKYPAAVYGGNYPDADGNDARPRSLVYEALLAAANDPSINLADFDQEDRYDLDGDGNLREPDGIIDHLMIMHAGVGEEAGGGALGTDAIWSHRWNLGGVATIPGTTAQVGYWNGMMGAYDYTIQPEDAATGVCAHEYGHDLGLPDEYDTIYSGRGEPVSYWSIMSSGSWAGVIGGTEPTGFSPWAKQFFQQTIGGNWLTGTTIEYDEITTSGIELTLDQASTKGVNNDVVRINLPDKVTNVNTPTSGQYEYYGGMGMDLDNAMYTSVDLTNASNAKLTFNAWYQIEEDWDYAGIFVSVDGRKWDSLAGNITTAYNPNENNPGNGITGDSKGWVKAEFDLSAYAGKNVYLLFNYWTDSYVVEAGFYADDIQVVADGNVVLSDNADNNTVFILDGFEKSNGTRATEHYYLVEWRNHSGVDKGLAHIRRGASLMSFEPGMVIWYVDNKYDNNWVGLHPGDGFLGVVDADQHLNKWSDNAIASTSYQVHDAAFSLKKTEKMYIDYSKLYGISLKDNNTNVNALFSDKENYVNRNLPDAGRNVPNYGIKIRVTAESSDRSTAKVLVFK